MVGPDRLELSTSVLSGPRSNRLSYGPINRIIATHVWAGKPDRTLAGATPTRTRMLRTSFTGPFRAIIRVIVAKEEFKFDTALRVRWPECDPQGIVYNGSYMDYLEVGQAEYYRNLGFSIYKLAETGYFDTAVVKGTLEFKHPARVEDLLDVHMRVSHIGNTSITMNMEIYAQNTDRTIATGEAIYVGYDTGTGTTRPVPTDLRELIDWYERTGEALPLDGYPNLAAAASEGTRREGEDPH